MTKNILIVTYYFYPEISPRAFRTTELVKELARRGHNIDLLIPDNDFDYSDFINCFSINIKKVKSGIFLNKKNSFNNSLTKNISLNSKRNSFLKIKNLLREVYKNLLKFVYIGGTTFEYGFLLAHKIISLKKHYDICVSIGLPINIHAAVFYSSFFDNNIAKIKVADYGDPFYYNDLTPKIFYYRLFEKSILKRFNYISVPTKKAVSSYLDYKSKNKIKVIPQGFNLNDIKIGSYIKHNIPTFCYAGSFYEKLRNPVNFFDFLIKFDKPFNFIIYTDLNNLENYKVLKDLLNKSSNIIIKNIVDRKDCIYELSKMDFLINIKNSSENQSPSKTIDYLLAKRPIFNLSQNHFDKKKFLKYYNANYEDFNQMEKNKILSNFDIKNIADKFLSLI